MITTSRQFADVLSGAPRVASRPRWHQSSNDFLYRNSVPCFFVMMPPPSTVVTQFDNLSLSFADPWWKVIHDFSCIYIPHGLDVSTSQFSRGMERGLPWDVKWLQVRRTVVWEAKPMARSSAAVRIVPPCAASNNACRRQQWCWKKSPSEHHHILQHCHWKGIRMKDIQKWRCLVMLCNNVLDTFR